MLMVSGVVTMFGQGARNYVLLLKIYCHRHGQNESKNRNLFLSLFFFDNAGVLFTHSQNIYYNC